LSSEMKSFSNFSTNDKQPLGLTEKKNRRRAEGNCEGKLKKMQGGHVKEGKKDLQKRRKKKKTAILAGKGR